jgi:hypothetical protein
MEFRQGQCKTKWRSWREFYRLQDLSATIAAGRAGDGRDPHPLGGGSMNRWCDGPGKIPNEQF